MRARWLLASLGLLGLLAVAWALLPRGPTPVVDGTVTLDSGPVLVTRGHVFDRLRVGYVRRGTVYATEDLYMYVSEDGGRSFERRGRLPKVDVGWLGRLKDWILRTELVRRWRRNDDVRHLAVLSDGTIIVIYDMLYRSLDGGWTFEAAGSYEGDEPPFPHGSTVDGTDCVYFGEYAGAPRPHPVSVYRGCEQGSEWDVVYTFSSGAIFHVHSITWDRYRERLWVTTGDRDEESWILYTEDGFATLDTLGGGAQQWRAVSLLVTPDALYWGSDNDRTGAAIYRWGFSEGQLEYLQQIGKPAYYSTQLSDGTLAIGATYEPESDYTRTYAPEPTAELWISRNGSDWYSAVARGYDPEFARIGKSRATFVLPAGDGSADALMLTPEVVSPGNFTLEWYSVSWSEGPDE